MITRQCRSCDQEIPATRLKAKPSASLCTTCQTTVEETDKQNARLDRPFGRLESFLSKCSPGEFNALLDYGGKKADSQ